MIRLDIHITTKSENFKTISRIIEELVKNEKVNYSIQTFGYSLTYEHIGVSSGTNKEITAQLSKIMDLADNFQLY